MAIFEGAGVAIVTPMKENLEVTMTSWKNYWRSRLQAAQTLSLSAEQQENLQH